MNGWTFAGWMLAALSFFALLQRMNAHRDEITKLQEEREALWEQINAWKPIVEEFAIEREQRARLAVTN